MTEAIGRRFRYQSSDSDQAIQSVMKAMALLERVGQLGVAPVSRLSSEMDLPKPTVVRLLQTLTTCGFLRHVSSRTGYCLTSKLDTIASGFSGIAALLEASIPTLDELTREIRWPVSLATFDGKDCIVRYSTIPISPYAHARSTIGKRLDLLTSAHGKATLAHFPTKQRLALMEDARKERSGCAFDELEADAVRTRGYAVRTSGRDPTTNTVAVPIVLERKIEATLGVTFFVKAIRPDGYASLAGRLEDAATSIRDAL